jgi:hypothetical protein
MSTALQSITRLDGPDVRADPDRMSEITNEPIARRGLLAGSLALVAVTLSGRPVRGASKPIVSVHKSPT